MARFQPKAHIRYGSQLKEKKKTGDYFKPSHFEVVDGERLKETVWDYQVAKGSKREYNDPWERKYRKTFFYSLGPHSPDKFWTEARRYYPDCDEHWRDAKDLIVDTARSFFDNYRVLMGENDYLVKRNNNKFKIIETMTAGDTREHDLVVTAGGMKPEVYWSREEGNVKDRNYKYRGVKATHKITAQGSREREGLDPVYFLQIPEAPRNSAKWSEAFHMANSYAKCKPFYQFATIFTEKTVAMYNLKVKDLNTEAHEAFRKTVQNWYNPRRPGDRVDLYEEEKTSGDSSFGGSRLNPHNVQNNGKFFAGASFAPKESGISAADQAELMKDVKIDFDTIGFDPKPRKKQQNVIKENVIKDAEEDAEDAFQKEFPERKELLQSGTVVYFGNKEYRMVSPEAINHGIGQGWLSHLKQDGDTRYPMYVYAFKGNLKTLPVGADKSIKLLRSDKIVRYKQEETNGKWPQNLLI